jgi:hypothetical protein
MGLASDTKLGRRTAIAWMAGGGLWVLGALTDHATGWRFFTAEALWIAADLALLAGLLGLGRLRPHGDGRTAQVAFVVAVIGRLVFLAAETTLLVAANNKNSVGTALLPLGAVLTALSMIVLGCSVIRQHIWHGPARFGPLAMGAYPFLAMFPIVAISGGPDIVAIGGWGVAAFALGLAVRSASTPAGAIAKPALVPA